MRPQILSLIVFFGASSLSWGSSFWIEGGLGQGDAGGLPGGANFTVGTGPLTDIFGALTDVTGGADMYEIYISDPANFSAMTVGDNSLGKKAIVNPALYLFALNGAGLFGNDNISKLNAQASIPLGTTNSLTPDWYFILITASGNLPENVNGLPIFGDLTNTNTLAGGSSSPLRIRQYGTSVATPNPTDSGKGYDIILTGATFASPEPSTVFLMGCGLAGLGWRLRRNRVRRR